MFEAGAEALSMLLTVDRLLYLIIGVLVGLVVGIIPGLGGIVGMSLLLPFIFGQDPTTAIALLIGMMAVTQTSDTFPAVLLGIPGTAGSQATIMDGYPMAQAGRANQALGAAFFASMIGGIIGAIFLMAVIPIARPIVLSFGSPQLLMLTVLGLSTVGVLVRGSAVKGVLAGLIGMMLSAVGGAPAAPEYRYSFDSLYLLDGISLVTLALGLFAIPELLQLVVERRSVSEGSELEVGGRRAGLKAVVEHRWLVLRSAGAGASLATIPGIGGAVIDWITYGVAAQTCRDNSEFGKGDIRGVIAPESANNAKEGGSLIPTLMFGIPGGGTTAILLGGLVMIGVQPGPSLLEGDGLALVLSIIGMLVLANILGTTLCMALSKSFAKLSLVSAERLVPFLVIMVFVAGYQTSRHWGDILVILAIGVAAWLMVETNWPRAPILIGFVLGPATERYLWISISRYGAEWLSDPVVILIGILVIGMFLYGARRSNRGSDATVDMSEVGSEGPPKGDRLDIVIASLVLASVVAMAVVALNFLELARWFPLYAGIAAAVVATLNLVIVASVGWRSSNQPSQSDLGVARTKRRFRSLMWLFGVLVGVPIWLGLSLTVYARIGWLRASIGVGVSMAVLISLRELAGLEFPVGVVP